MQWKECNIGQTIWREPQPDHYWFDQNFENFKAFPKNGRSWGETNGNAGVVALVRLAQSLRH